MTLPLSEIARLIGGGPIPPAQDKPIELLLTDSRRLEKPAQSLFFALQTATGDGHAYLQELYDKGMRCFVVSHSTDTQNMPEAILLRVPDSLQALQTLATSVRQRYTCPIIGITGSNGKTIVKEWLFQLLHEHWHIVRSPRSYNSQLGVPLSVWNWHEGRQLAIFEAGISLPGEMERLERILHPEIGIFTNIGTAHQAAFHSIEEKLQEKLQLFKHSKVLIYHRKYPVEKYIHTINPQIQLLSWGWQDEQACLNLLDLHCDANGATLRYRYQGQEAETRLPFTDESSIENAMHCLACCLYLHKSADLTQLQAVDMRMHIKQGKEGCLLIDDTYNSDTTALAIALDFLRHYASDKYRCKTLILSDLQQTGIADEQLYREVSHLVQQRNIERIIGIGPKLRMYWHLFPVGSRFFLDTREMLQAGLEFKNELVLVKGAREFHLEDIVSSLEQKRHETIMEVDLDNLLHNFRQLRSFLRPKTKTMAMIKANAYGCGAVEVARSLGDHCEYFGVAVADEGVDLRRAGIRNHLVVMNPEPGSFHLLTAYHLEPEIYSFELLHRFADFAACHGSALHPIHLKIDTGMHRLGFLPEEIPALVKELRQISSLRVESAFSHLATADELGMDEFTLAQLNRFKQATDYLRQNLPYPFLRHILNTAGVQRFHEYQYEMVRMGIGLYGIGLVEEADIRSIASLKTVILQIKQIKQNEPVGYSRKGLLTRDSRIAAIPIGYADGLRRSFGNRKGYALVHGQPAPYIGNICMDVCMIDVTDIPEACAGDEVTIFGERPSISELAERTHTIPYEILTSVSPRVKRIHSKE